MPVLTRALLGIFLMLSPAFGADLATRKPAANLPIMAGYNWSGFYVGLQAGYAFGQMRQSDANATSRRHDWNGFTGGATVGYSHQMGQIVLGIEGDISYSGLKGSFSADPGWGCAVANGCKSKVEWFGTVRGRLGYAFERFLPYVTAGLAVGDVKALIETSCGTGFCGRKTSVGFTIGGGAEYALTSNWTVKSEYLYVDLGKTTVNKGAGGFRFAVDPAHFHVVRVGANYRF